MRRPKTGAGGEGADDGNKEGKDAGGGDLENGPLQLEHD